jgi:AcrR family transcriptional regulator
MIPGDREACLDNERHRVREAAQRLLTGVPRHSNGRHTVAALAVETGISRQRLYEHHADLVAEFKAATGRGANPPNVQALQQQLADSRNRTHQLEEQVALLQNRIRTLSAVIAELSLEAQARNVVALASRRRHAT